jgi:hypothetical protein
MLHPPVLATALDHTVLTYMGFLETGAGFRLPWRHSVLVITWLWFRLCLVNFLPRLWLGPAYTGQNSWLDYACLGNWDEAAQPGRLQTATAPAALRRPCALAAPVRHA